MMATGDWLLLRLPSDAGAAPAWALADATGAMLPLPAGGSDEELRVMAAGRQVALLVPASEVALFNVQLPPANEARLQQLAPFALEEQVSEDLDRLHFAVGARDAQSGQVPVAVASRERVRQWLEQAAALSLYPRALFSEADLAPQLPGHVTLWLAGEQMILRAEGMRPVPFPADDPELALTTVLGPEADLAQVNLAVFASPEEWARHQGTIEQLRDRVASLTVQLSVAGPLALLAQGVAASAPVNLLQGPFKPQARGENQWRRWRTAAALLLFLLLLHGAGAMWELRQLRKASAQLDESIARVYGTIFPGQKPGPSVRRSLEARLKAITSGGSPAGELMPLLAAVAAARQNVPVARLDGLNFKPGGLQLDITAPDAATLEQFSQALRAGGYVAEVSRGNQSEGGFKGQIDMKAGS